MLTKLATFLMIVLPLGLIVIAFTFVYTDSWNVGVFAVRYQVQDTVSDTVDCIAAGQQIVSHESIRQNMSGKLDGQMAVVGKQMLANTTPKVRMDDRTKNKDMNTPIDKDRGAADSNRIENQTTELSHVEHRTRKYTRAYVNITEKGRLGNQMFQYAALFSITKGNSSWTPYLLPDTYLQLRQTFHQESLSIPFMSVRPVAVTRVRDKHNADLDSIRLESLPLRNTTLEGYFQSWKFNHNISKELRDEFTFPPGVQSVALKFLESLLPGNQSSVVQVGIHVRRTNMITQQRIALGETPCPASYFHHAMQYFSARYTNVQFIVASDDMDWCRHNILGENVVYSSQSFYVDLAILSLADHVITSVGTFGWWAGWLVRGQTIYYGAVPPPGTYMARLKTNNSWIPPKDEFNDWIPIK